MIIQAEHWKDLEWDTLRWPNFSPKELAERSEGWEVGLSPILLNVYSVDKLQKMRDLYGNPIHVASGYRSPKYNNEVATTGYDGPHTKGRAFDLKVRGSGDRYYIMKYALQVGFLGIGDKYWGIHVDDDVDKPRPALYL